MKILLHPPQFLHELGRRENNEDCIYPSANDLDKKVTNNLFMVCDGVGGAAKGEVASDIVCTVLGDYLENREEIFREDINHAIGLAENKIDSYIKLHGEAKGMATTLTLLAIDNKGATVAHLGDSRVYQIRGGNIIFKTSDHSFVNELVSKNLITEVEALNHPKRNVVTKAIMGGHMHQEADVSYLKDVQADDYFFLCTDGVLESVSDFSLVEILNHPSLSNTDKIERIKSKCQEKSRDNFSAYLIQVDKIADESAAGALNQLIWKNQKSVLYLLLLVLAVAIGAFAFVNLGTKNTTVSDDAYLKTESINSSLEMLNSMDTNEILIEADTLEQVDSLIQKQPIDATTSSIDGDTSTLNNIQ